MCSVELHILPPKKKFLLPSVNRLSTMINGGYFKKSFVRLEATTFFTSDKKEMLYTKESKSRSGPETTFTSSLGKFCLRVVRSILGTSVEMCRVDGKRG